MIQKYWNRFLAESGNQNAALKGVICFGDNVDAANQACAHVLSGKKTAMTYPENGYRVSMKGEAKIGDLNIVADWSGTPVCVIETTAIEKQAFDHISDAIKAKEISAVEDWEEIKEAEFKREIEELGGEFNTGILVFAEEFHVIWPKEA